MATLCEVFLGVLSARGFAPTRVYPASNEVSKAHHTQRLVDSFNEGQLFVH